jgi:hypothetical protein
MGQLLRCINCDKVFFKTPFDRWPEYECAPIFSTASARMIERDDSREFLASHRGHRLEELKVYENSYVGEKPYIEPVKTSYFKATNGKERFVVKKFRERIDEPLSYQLMHGNYSLRCTRIDIQSQQIKKQLEREFKHSPISDYEIEAFLKLCQEVALSADVEKLGKTPEEREHPLTKFCKLDQISLKHLLKKCHTLFGKQGYREIDEFIYRHIDDGVLMLKATFEISFS